MTAPSDEQFVGEDGYNPHDAQAYADEYGTEYDEPQYSDEAYNQSEDEAGILDDLDPALSDHEFEIANETEFETAPER